MQEDLLAAAEEYETPLYVYDLDGIRTNLTEIRTAFGLHTHIHFASKALDNSHILRQLREWGCGVDCVSQEEMMIAIRCGFKPKEINFTPSGAPLAEYFWALKMGISVHVDNVQILEILGKRTHGLPVSLRFNPNVRSGGHVQLQVGADDSKFGLHAEEMPKVAEIVKKYEIDVRRFHVHVGSDIKTGDDFLECWRQAFALAEEYSDTVKMIDLGGGFGVQYFPDDPVLDMIKLGLDVNALRDDYHQRTGKRIELMLEPGKSIVGNAGYLLVEVTAIKNIQSSQIVYVNSGFNHMLRPMYYGAHHRFDNLSNRSADKSKYKLVGYLCETDTFSESVELAEVRRGDILCMYNAGAYAMTMASNYNSRRRPAEVTTQNGQLKLIRRRETLDDILATEIDL
jgi:diaminopimelate decarboxylase